MCLVGFSLNMNDTYPLLLAANRDEYFARPTSAAHWWPDRPNVFAGQDQQAGGTWLAASRNGRIAALTNFREAPPASSAQSRGMLVTAALNCDIPLDQLLAQLLAQGENLAGYSLLLFDWRRSGTGAPVSVAAYCICNRTSQTVRLLAPGLYGLSNGPIDAPWPKSLRLKRTIDQVQGSSQSTRNAALLAALTDSSLADSESADLPDTGVGLAMERQLAPAFIRANGQRRYGTRSTALVSVAADSTVDFDEWTWSETPQAQCTARRTARFTSANQTPYPAMQNQP